jgi:hypothetical protein
MATVGARAKAAAGRTERLNCSLHYSQTYAAAHNGCMVQPRAHHIDQLAEKTMRKKYLFGSIGLIACLALSALGSAMYNSLNLLQSIPPKIDLAAIAEAEAYTNLEELGELFFETDLARADCVDAGLAGSQAFKSADTLFTLVASDYVSLHVEHNDALEKHLVGMLNHGTGLAYHAIEHFDEAEAMFTASDAMLTESKAILDELNVSEVAEKLIEARNAFNAILQQ